MSCPLVLGLNRSDKQKVNTRQSSQCRKEDSISPNPPLDRFRHPPESNMGCHHVFQLYVRRTLYIHSYIRRVRKTTALETAERELDLHYFVRAAVEDQVTSIVDYLAEDAMLRENCSCMGRSALRTTPTCLAQMSLSRVCRGRPSRGNNHDAARHG